MGYQTALHLIDVKVRATELARIRRTSAGQGRRPVRLEAFLERLAIDQAGFLVFKADPDDESSYVPDDEGFVPALSGKWYAAEHFARWVARCSERGGRLVLHSLEADGGAWGWEFDGRGRMRALGLTKVGPWT